MGYYSETLLPLRVVRVLTPLPTPNYLLLGRGKRKAGPGKDPKPHPVSIYTFLEKEPGFQESPSQRLELEGNTLCFTPHFLTLSSSKEQQVTSSDCLLVNFCTRNETDEIVVAPKAEAVCYCSEGKKLNDSSEPRFPVRAFT